MKYYRYTVYWYIDTGKYYVQYTAQKQYAQCAHARKLRILGSLDDYKLSRY